MRALGVSLVAYSCGETVHSQDDSKETYASNGVHMELAVGVEPHNGPFGFLVEDPSVVRTSPKNGCTHIHYCHNKTVGGALRDGMAVC